MSFYKKKKEVRRMGIVTKKILLLLGTGLALSLSGRPDRYFLILKSAAKEWQKINQRSLREAIQRLYQSQMVDYKEHSDGTVELAINENGKRKFLRYDLDAMKLKKQARWDGLWRIVMFDIPENKKQARDALARKLRHAGFLPLQKSVFVYPHDCWDEVGFISEIFEVKPYVRFIIAKDVDVALDLKHKFDL